MRYKELPAFEKNEFDEGDTVNVYMQGNSKPYETYVLPVQNYQEKDMVKVSGHTTLVHYKQCRKLEPMKPREWTIHTCPRHVGATTAFFDHKCEEQIKVREVLTSDSQPECTER